jgi:hypothetical protein
MFGWVNWVPAFEGMTLVYEQFLLSASCLGAVTALCFLLSASCSLLPALCFLLSAFCLM